MFGVIGGALVPIGNIIRTSVRKCQKASESVRMRIGWIVVSKDQTSVFYSAREHWVCNLNIQLHRSHRESGGKNVKSWNLSDIRLRILVSD